MNCAFVVFEAVAETAKKLSLEEIGAMEGITREGVRQIEKRALKKIRLPLLGDETTKAPRNPGASLQSAARPPGW
jgi:DNA-directed RNA polymerase sigma subunit (sigma70/sigma32)